MSDTVLFQTAYLGDAVLTLPLVEALAERFGPVDIVATPYGAPVFDRHPGVGRVIRFDKRGADRGLSGILGVAAQLRAARYTRAYLAHGSLRSGLVALLGGTPVRIGFGDAPGRLLYTRRVTAEPGIPEYRRLLALAGTPAAAVPVSPVLPPPPRMRIAPGARSGAGGLLAAGGIGSEGGFVVLAPGSVQPTKRWPFFRELAVRLLERRNVVVLGGPGEPRLFPAAPARAHGSLLDLTGKVTVLEAAAVIERALYVVANDSAPLHIANAVGTPVVAIFGPTDPDRGFGPLGEMDRVAHRRDLPCRPCSSHGGRKCPKRHHACMQGLAPEAVLAEIRELEKDLEVKCA